MTNDQCLRLCPTAFSEPNGLLREPNGLSLEATGLFREPNGLIHPSPGQGRLGGGRPGFGAETEHAA